MDYLLAAHINVTGGTEAAMVFNQMAVQVNNFGKAAASASTGALSGEIDKAAKSTSLLSTGLGQVGVALTRMATYQGIHMVVNALGAGVGAVLDFDHQMTQSLAIQTGVTDKIRGNMESLAKTIAVDLGMAPGKVAEAFYFLASAGLTVEQQMAALPVVANFARAGMMSLEQATEKLYDSLTALGLKAQDPQEQMRNLIHLSDLLTTAAIASQGSVKDFTTALANKAGADIKTYGIDLEEGIALLEVFADRGIKGAKAGTAFDMVIRDMAIKATVNADAFKKFGIEIFDSEGNYNSLITIFKQLDAALLNMPIEQRTVALDELGYTLKSGQLIQGLLGTSGVLEKFTEGLDKAGGTAQRVAEKQMESLRAKLDQMKSMSMVFAIDGFEKLEQAAGWLAETFAPAILEIIETLELLAAGVKPVATAFAGLVAATVVTGLRGVAEALEFVFGIISEHPGLVQALGAALAGMAAVHIVGGLIAIGGAIKNFIHFQALLAQEAITNLIARIMAVASTEGVLAAVRVGLDGIARALASPVAIGAGIGLAILFLHKSMQDAKKEADEFRKGLEAKYDTTTLLGISQAMDDTEQRMNDLAKKGKNFFLNIFDAFDIVQSENAMRDWNREAANATLGIQLIANAATGASLPIASWAEGLKRSGMDIKDFDITGLRKQITDAGVDMGAMGQNTDQVSKFLQQLARDSGIDIHSPVDEWVPKLAAAYGELMKVREITHMIGGVAEGSAGGMSTMEKAISTLRDEAASAEDKLKALKDAMDGVSGGSQNLFDMETKFAAGMNEFTEALAKNGPVFSSFTEAGRENRDMLSDMTDRARDFALGQAEVSGNMQIGVQHLSEYAAGIAGAMREAGAAEPVIQELLRQMGLTPEQINTLFKITAEPKPEEVKKDIDEAALPGGAPRDAPILPSVPPADIAIAMSDLGGLAGGVGGAGYPAPIVPGVVPDAMAESEVALNTTARKRDSEAAQYGTGWPTVNDIFNRTAGRRDSQADQYGTGWGSVNYWFNEAARGRTSVAEQNAVGWEAANYWLNYAARNRTSTITVDVQADYRLAQLGVDINTANIAEGGIVHAYRYGGFENHVAQIGKAGASRIWNEPETGGEAYIPLAMAKRQRSLAIWEETGRLLGAASSGPHMTVSAPMTITVNAAESPEATAKAVASHAEKAVTGAMRRVMTEMRAL